MFNNYKAFNLNKCPNFFDFIIWIGTCLRYMEHVIAIWNKSFLYGTGHSYMEHVTHISLTSRVSKPQRNLYFSNKIKNFQKIFIFIPNIQNFKYWANC